MIYREFIRKCLLDNNYGVYSMIVETYKEQVEVLKKPALFRKWLSGELGVPIEMINLSSLNSALQQQRKKQAKGSSKAASAKTGFSFSRAMPEGEAKPRIQEL